jgi:hypothetical protein
LIMPLKGARRGPDHANDGYKQHDSAKWGEVKSHPRFHRLDLPYALARGALARA